MEPSYVYIMSSERNGTLYIGITTDLERRVIEHKKEVIGGFSKKYGVHRLVFYGVHGDVLSAIYREKQIKKWKRRWKIRMIEDVNPDWLDLSDEFLDMTGPLPTQG